MSWTKRDQQVWMELQVWEERYFDYEPNDFTTTYEKMLRSAFSKLNANEKNKVVSKMNALLFHLHALIQNSQMQADAKERLLNEARLFNEGIETTDDLKKLRVDELRYITNQHIARQRFLSFAQGGITGAGGFFLLGLDFPAVIAMNLRSVQQIALIYGNEVRLPSEMMIALKVFHTAALPKRLQHQAWIELEEEVYKGDHDPFFYEGSDELIDASWLDHTLKQIGKAVTIGMMRKKLVQGIPLFGMAFGASMNYRFSGQVTKLAHRFYLKRYLIEKKERIQT